MNRLTFVPESVLHWLRSPPATEVRHRAEAASPTEDDLAVVLADTLRRIQLTKTGEGARHWDGLVACIDSRQSRRGQYLDQFLLANVLLGTQQSLQSISEAANRRWGDRRVDFWPYYTRSKHRWLTGPAKASRRPRAGRTI